MSRGMGESRGVKVGQDPSKFDKRVLSIQVDYKVSILSWIEKLNIKLAEKVWFCIPWCRMVLMPIVRHTLLVDIQKMECSFQ
jgi:hypothetical protein